MNDAKDWESVAKLQRLRRQGVKSDQVSLDKWHDLRVRLQGVKRAAEEAAYQGLDAGTVTIIEQRINERALTQEANITGELLNFK